MKIGDTIPPRPKNNLSDSLEDILGQAAKDDRQRLLDDIGRLEEELDKTTAEMRKWRSKAHEKLKMIEAAKAAFFAHDTKAMRKALGIGEGE